MNMKPLETARAAWGPQVPDWIERLATECGRTSQSKVAAALDRSATMISQVLSKKYPGDLLAIEERVRGTYMDQTVVCPALGDLPTQECQDWRALAKEFVLVNPRRAQMFRACNRCPRHLGEPK